jgi:RNA polymerase sigma-70 factor (ECF subfamily)
MAIGEPFARVLDAARGGEEWAFGLLYEELNPALVRYFGSRAPRDADDLAAETWLGAARRLRDFEGDETHFRAWIFTIAHRRITDYWQARRIDQLVDPATLGDTAASSGDPEQLTIDSASALAAVQRITAALNREQAEVVLLRVVGGLSVEEVARILGKRAGAVRVIQHRALRKLSKEISVEDVTL